MKKSQILAALALALALGVVAPATGVYAQITPNDATQEQKDAVYDDARDVLNVALGLKNINEYKALYDAINADNTGIIDVYSDASEDLVKAYNKTTTTTDTIAAKGYMQGNAGINGDITSVEGKLNDNQLYHKTDGKYDNIKADKEFAPLKTVNKVATVTTMKQAYDAVIAIRDAASDNLSTLTNNYIAGSGDPSAPNIIDTVSGLYQSILDDANAWLTFVDTHYGTVTTPETVANLANDIKAIDEDAYDNMTEDDAWTDTYNGKTNIQKAAQYQMIINVAKKLPKYNYVAAVAEGIDNVQAVLSPENGVTTTNVSYANAKAYVKALSEAVVAYKDGKAPVDDGTGEGTNKPGDDNTDPNAPDTGILADAEANASTTVAMVAGIATALTAAGAGVVAYRNARRSTRK